MCTGSSPGDSTPTRYEYYVWDGDDVVLDFVDSNGGATPSAILDMRYLHGAAVDQVLAQETAGGTVHWMLADHQGTVHDLATNAGDVTGSHVVFDSFGKVKSGTLGTRFAYTGQEYDAETGLYYYNARWYNPNIGRFVTQDPIGFWAGDTNQYRYVGNNSPNLVDPSGNLPSWNDVKQGASDYWYYLTHPDKMAPDLQKVDNAAKGVAAGALLAAGGIAVGGAITPAVAIGGMLSGAIIGDHYGMPYRGAFTGFCIGWTAGTGLAGTGLPSGAIGSGTGGGAGEASDEALDTADDWISEPPWEDYPPGQHWGDPGGVDIASGGSDYPLMGGLSGSPGDWTWIRNAPPGTGLPPTVGPVTPPPPTDPPWYPPTFPN